MVGHLSFLLKRSLLCLSLGTCLLGSLVACSDEDYSPGTLVASVESLSLAPGEDAIISAHVEGRKALATIWSVEPSDLARVDGNGLVTALRPGTGYVVGNYGTSTVRIPLTVLSSEEGLQLRASISVALREEENMQLIASYKGETVQAQYSTSTPAIVSVSAEGIVTGLTPGTAVVTATYEGRTASYTFKVRAIEFLLPYLKLYNSTDHILEFEALRGNKTTVDQEMGTIRVETGSKDFPVIAYDPGARAQLYPADGFVMTTKKFAAFLKAQGFEGTAQEIPGFYTYTPYTNNKYKTISAFGVLGATGDYAPLNGLGFQIKALPRLEIPYPILSWDATLEEITSYERSQGRSLRADIVLSSGLRRVIFSQKTEREEYTELLATYYYINTDGRLVQQESVVAPAGYYLENVHSSTFMIQDRTKEILKAGGFEKTGNYRNGSTNLDLFKNEAKQTKMVMGTQRASVDGYKTMMAVFRFTQIDDTTYDYDRQ